MKCNVNVKRPRGNHDPLTKIVKVTLPEDYPWKVLTWLKDDLADLLTTEELETISTVIRAKDFPALLELSEEWGLQKLSKIPLNELTHISNIRAKYQLSALLKKFQFNSNKDLRKAAAKEKFIQAETYCEIYNKFGFRDLIAGKTEEEACILTYMRAYIEQVIGKICPTKDIVTSSSRHGPGSNLDTYKGLVSKFHKYSNWPYSCTGSAIPYARFLIESDKRWLGALEDSYRSRFGIPKHKILDRQMFWEQIFEEVDYNRITFVPKNALIERTIAIEPAMNLMLQLGVDGYVRRRLKRFGVDLDSQKKNQRFSYQGSIGQSDETYVTLDLASASDTISLRVCKELLPEDWYSYLLKLRCPFGQLGEEKIMYNKISSMGNGFTFAIESLIFSAACFAVVKLNEGRVDVEKDYSVFGDDIIVRQKHSEQVINTLQRLGFKLNLEKTFLQGPIRESCGTDWIHGKPVRPVNFSSTPTTVMDLFVDINRIKRILYLRWGNENSICVNNMMRWIPERCREFVGPPSNEAFHGYLHVDKPDKSQKCGLWKFTQLTCGLAPLKCRDFFFRKLMHDLRGGQEDPSILFRKTKEYWKFNAGGSRFTVSNAKALTVSRSYSATSNWWLDYAEESIN